MIPSSLRYSASEPEALLWKIVRFNVKQLKPARGRESGEVAGLSECSIRSTAFSYRRVLVELERWGGSRIKPLDTLIKRL